ncbi:PH domain-containing protein [Microbispora sp. RL4-1S]|uniref:PH domain-containing protein n=1 Tax=Microbispora oryzae TaxID=2806554 RepID=A0A941AJA1_9ACTN|nr:PH domain-containing protein [Microbispora oryzae]MBP2704742.1 PH domain-containing protein [Microbispora oryzae]
MRGQVYRSRAGWVFGWAWLLFTAWNVWDLAAHGTMPSALVAGAVLGVVTALVFLLAMRPAVVAGEEGILVRNPLRNTRIPWSAVDDVIVTSGIVIESGETAVRCWVPQASARERARATRRAARAIAATASDTMSKTEKAAAEAIGARTHADWVGQQLMEARAERLGVEPGAARGAVTAQVTWSPSALAAVAAALALVVLIVVLSV